MNVPLVVAASLQADDIDAFKDGKMPANDAERNDICANSAKAHNHCAFANPHELPHGRLPAEDNEIADRHMPAQHNVVGEGDIAAHLTIMTYMRADHEQAALSDCSNAAIILGPRVHGDSFANVAVSTDDQTGRPAAVFHGLWRRAQRCKRVYGDARSYGGVSCDMNVGDKFAAVADHDIGPDDAIRSDGRALPDRYTRFDPGGWIDRSHSRTHDSMAPTSASATSCPATFASPRNHHIRFLRAIFLTWNSTVSPGMTG